MRGAIVGVLKLLFLGVKKGDISIEKQICKKEKRLQLISVIGKQNFYILYKTIYQTR